MVSLASLDMYRKIPAELYESTKRGSVMSIVSLLIMTTLIVLETKSYFTSTTVTDLKLDTSNKERVSRVTFNITFMDLKCKIQAYQCPVILPSLASTYVAGKTIHVFCVFVIVNLFYFW
jgi:hypothetical protein